MNWGIFMINMCRKVIRWSLFHLIVLNFTSDVVLFVLHHKWMEFLNSAGSKKCSREFICRVIGFNNCSILELEFSFSFVSDFKRIHVWTDLHIIISTESVTIVWTINKEVTDWGMMANLLNIDFSSINKLAF